MFRSFAVFDKALFFNFVRKDRDEGTQEVVSQITAGFANNVHSKQDHTLIDIRSGIYWLVAASLDTGRVLTSHWFLFSFLPTTYLVRKCTLCKRAKRLAGVRT
jgi:hypothetical protein